MIVTPTIKDKVLFELRDKLPLETFRYVDTKELMDSTETDFETLKAILYQFMKFGFLSEASVGRENSTIIVTADLHDYAHSGGFAVQEEIFKANIEKLGFEIENLRKQLGPDKLETVNKISSIAAAIFSGLALLPR